jgi:hypothetical protein
VIASQCERTAVRASCFSAARLSRGHVIFGGISCRHDASGSSKPRKIGSRGDLRPFPPKQSLSPCHRARWPKTRGTPLMMSIVANKAVMERFRARPALAWGGWTATATLPDCLRGFNSSALDVYLRAEGGCHGNDDCPSQSEGLRPVASYLR